MPILTSLMIRLAGWGSVIEPCRRRDILRPTDRRWEPVALGGTQGCGLRIAFRPLDFVLRSANPAERRSSYAVVHSADFSLHRACCHFGPAGGIFRARQRLLGPSPQEP